MTWLKTVMAVYAVLMLAGGVFGYVAKGSLPSIISSAAAAVLIAFGIWYAGKNQSLGFAVCAIVTLALIAFFGMRVAGGIVSCGAWYPGTGLP